MKKVLTTVFMLVLTITLLPLSSYADSAPLFKVDNKLFVTPEGEPAPYINKDKRTMGSLRLVGNALGVNNSDISWDAATQTAKLTKGDLTVEVTLGKKELRVNGEVVVMDTVAEMKQGRVFIPARFIGESLGWYVGYDSILKAVLFNSKPLSEMPTNNIEEVLGFTIVKQFPITTTVDGLEFTLHEMYLLDFDGEEAQAINDNYQFNTAVTQVKTLRKEMPDLKAYLVRSKVTIKNDSNKTIEYGNNNFTHIYYLGVVKGGGATPTRSYLDSHAVAVNQTDVLYRLKIAPNESVTGYYYTVIHDYKGINFLDMAVSNIYHHSEAIMIAVKE